MPSTRQMLDVPATTSSRPALNFPVSGLLSLSPGVLTAVSAMSWSSGVQSVFDYPSHFLPGLAGAHGNRTHLPACGRYHGFEARGAHQVPFRSPEFPRVDLRRK